MDEIRIDFIKKYKAYRTFNSTDWFYFQEFAHENIDISITQELDRLVVKYRILKKLRSSIDKYWIIQIVFKGSSYNIDKNIYIQNKGESYHTKAKYHSNRSMDLGIGEAAEELQVEKPLEGLRQAQLLKKYSKN